MRNIENMIVACICEPDTFKHGLEVRWIPPGAPKQIQFGLTEECLASWLDQYIGNELSDWSSWIDLAQVIRNFISLQSRGFHTEGTGFYTSKKEHQPHCECNVIAYAATHHIHLHKYIGVTKLSCYGCAVLIQALNQVLHTDYITRGCHSKLYPGYVPVELSSSVSGHSELAEALLKILLMDLLWLPRIPEPSRSDSTVAQGEVSHEPARSIHYVASLQPKTAVNPQHDEEETSGALQRAGISPPGLNPSVDWVSDAENFNIEDIRQALSEAERAGDDEE